MLLTLLFGCIDMVEIYRKIYSLFGEVIDSIDDHAYHDDDFLAYINDHISVLCEFLYTKLNQDEF